MNNEAGQFAQELEQIGRRVLNHCRNLPDTALQWPLPLVEHDSLLALATRLADTIDYWVLIQISDRSLFPARSSAHYPPTTFAELSFCYEAWIKEVHTMLDGLPDAFMGLFVGTHASEKEHWQKYRQKKQLLTTRQCLIHAVTECSAYAGQISLICQLLDDGNRLYAEVEWERHVSN